MHLEGKLCCTLPTCVLVGVSCRKAHQGQQADEHELSALHISFLHAAPLNICSSLPSAAFYASLQRGASRERQLPAAARNVLAFQCRFSSDSNLTPMQKLYFHKVKEVCSLCTQFPCHTCEDRTR